MVERTSPGTIKIYLQLGKEIKFRLDAINRIKEYFMGKNCEE